MFKFIKNFLKKIRENQKKKKLQKLYKQRLEELRKRDPFIYKH